MFVEIDQIAIDPALLARVKKGDDAARAEAKRLLKGTVLYVHALSTEPGEVKISLREAEQLGIVSAITIGGEGFD